MTWPNDAVHFGEIFRVECEMTTAAGLPKLFLMRHPAGQDLNTHRGFQAGMFGDCQVMFAIANHR
jgi:hypothetical protein